MGAEFQFGKMKMVLETDGDDSCITVQMYFMSLNYSLKIIKMVNFMLCIFYHNKKK